MAREKCEGCGIFTGGIEEQRLADYRGHRICFWCITQWGRKDRREGRETSWEEFAKPVSDVELNPPMSLPFKRTNQYPRNQS